jgi:hypothetical protein
VWFGFALVAEQFGELEAAATMYSRVEKPKADYPGASYDLAQQRRAELRHDASHPPKAVK